MPRLVGINHVALEVGSVDDALEFYGRIFDLKLRGRSGRMAFIDMGDQFIAIAEGRTQPPDRHRHFGLVVDDKEATRQALADAGAQILPGGGLDFIDPWGNHVQVVDYRDVQFTKALRCSAAWDWKTWRSRSRPYASCEKRAWHRGAPRPAVDIGRPAAETRQWH
jgi:catechol 2,3-dioxygenase-like lactoylglutathione lyase family enzyme